MTKEEFVDGYAIRSGMSVESFYWLGLTAAPCDCGEPGCQGWQVISQPDPLPDGRTAWKPGAMTGQDKHGKKTGDAEGGRRG